MAETHSFDISTGCDLQEVDNAVNQTNKELGTRYDFKGVRFGIELKKADNTILLSGPDTFKLQAVWDVLQSKMVRRNVSLKNLKPGAIDKAGGSTVRQEIKLQQSIESDVAKEIVKFIKDQKRKKVQASIQGDQVRVSGPSLDDLQETMGTLRGHDFGIELSFGNYR